MSVVGMKSSRLSLQFVIRVLADVAMLNVALLVGLLLSEGIAKRPFGVTGGDLSRFAYMTILSVGIFRASGFYTHGRAYRGRYKALVVLQAVALSFVIFGFLGYALPDYFEVPRPMFLISAALTECFLIGSRLWSSLWKKVVSMEAHSACEGNSQPQRILVIGGAGYIGSALLPKLLKQGYQVRLLDVFMFGTDPIADVITHKNLDVMEGDFRQINTVVEAMRGMDAVIHLGAIVGDPACALDEELTIDINLIATRLIAECAKGNGIRRFIFASTCSVYGASDQILDEQSSLKPVSLYARSKVASENVLSSMVDKRFRPTLLRFGTVYGLAGRTRFDLVINLLTAKAVVDGKITVFGADQWRPFVHVEDVASAVARVLESPLEDIGGEVFNVGSDPQNKTLGQIGEMIHKQVPTADLIVGGADGDRRNYRVDFSKIEKKLGFKPDWTIENGIKQVIDSIESGRVLDYKDPRYSNVKYLTEEMGIDLMKTDTSLLRSVVKQPLLY